MFHVKHYGAPVDDLSRELSFLGLYINQSVMERCLDYWQLLCSSSPRLNVISRNAIAEGPVRHIVDSLAALVQWLPSGPLRLMDVGSGGGLPGIPLTIAHSELETTLLEARERKADWLSSTVRELGLEDRIDVITGRIEAQVHEELHTFDIITARAVAAPERLFRWVLPGLGPGSQLLLWHSDRQLDGIVEAVQGCSVGRTFELYNTLSYYIRSICFSSNISSIREVH